MEIIRTGDPWPDISHEIGSSTKIDFGAPVPDPDPEWTVVQVDDPNDRVSLVTLGAAVADLEELEAE